jgi:hypothetical protein
MQYLVGQELNFTSPKGKREKITILKRSIDYKGGYIDEPKYQGNFDYLASVERGGNIENIFCNHSELS